MSEKKLGDDPLAILVTNKSKWIARFISRIITLFLTNIILNIKMSLKLGCHWEPSIKYLRPKGGGRGSRQKCTSIVFMTSFHCLKAKKGGGTSENYQIWAYVHYGWSTYRNNFCFYLTYLTIGTIFSSFSSHFYLNYLTVFHVFQDKNFLIFYLMR